MVFSTDARVVLELQSRLRQDPLACLLALKQDPTTSLKQGGSRRVSSKLTTVQIVTMLGQSTARDIKVGDLGVARGLDEAWMRCLIQSLSRWRTYILY